MGMFESKGRPFGLGLPRLSEELWVKSLVPRSTERLWMVFFWEEKKETLKQQKMDDTHL